MNARHRVSKMLLMGGRVYAKPGPTWTKTHRQWLGAQRFDDPISALIYVDLLAAVDGLTSRKQALADRICCWRPTPSGGRRWPGCGAFAGLTP